MYVIYSVVSIIYKNPIQKSFLNLSLKKQAVLFNSISNIYIKIHAK